MDLPRWNPVRTVLLDDGSILVWQDSQGAAAGSIFNPKNNTFTLMDRQYPVFRVSGKTVHIKFSTKPEATELGVNLFSNNPDLGYLLVGREMRMRSRKEYATAIMPSGKILVAGGLVSFKSGTGGVTEWRATELVEEYDPSTGQTVRVGSLTQPRTRSQAVLLPNGDVLIAGGKSKPPLSSLQLASTDLYKPGKRYCVKGPNLELSDKTSYWERLVDWEYPLIASTKTDLILFNTTRNGCERMRNIVADRQGSSFTYLPGNRLLITGGELVKAAEHGRCVSDVYLYDLRAKSAKRIGSLAEGRAYHRVVRLAHGRILVIGGGAVEEEDSVRLPYVGVTVPGSYKFDFLYNAEIGSVGESN